MAKRKSKSVSFDAMVKFFMQNYGIPTKNDIDKLITRMDRIEKLIKTSTGPTKGRRKTTGTTARNKPGVAAYENVLRVIKKYKNGASFADIQKKTGYGDKKIRNIIYRLYNLKRIKRKNRGVYIAK